MLVQYEMTDIRVSRFNMSRSSFLLILSIFPIKRVQEILFSPENKRENHFAG